RHARRRTPRAGRPYAETPTAGHREQRLRYHTDRLCLRPLRPCGKDRRAFSADAHPAFSPPAMRCRSSVVEHPLGKGEVVSSILTGSTTHAPDALALQTTCCLASERIP